MADSLSSSVGAYLCDPAFCFFIKSKNLGVSYSQFSEKDKGGKSNVTGISRKANKELHGNDQLPSEGQAIIIEG